MTRRVACSCQHCRYGQRNGPLQRSEVEDAVEMLLAGANLAEAASHVGLTRQHLLAILRACYGGPGALRRVLGVRVAP
jgi:hypothetical protein